MVFGWASVAVVLMLRCIGTRPLHGVWSDPDNLEDALHRIDQDFDALHGHELAMMQDRISLNRDRNGDIARWRDRCRYAALGVPLLTAVVGCWPN